MIIKKRQLLLATLVLALAAAVFVNWYYTRPDAEAAGAPSPSAAGPQTKREANLGDARYVVSNGAKLEESSSRAKASEYFAEAKTRRKAARDEAEEAYGKIIKDKTSSPEAIAKACESLDKLIKDSALECDVENLITAKAGRENLVILNGENAEIIVENGSLDEVSAVRIKEIVVKHTDRPAENINIIEMEY